MARLAYRSYTRDVALLTPSLAPPQPYGTRSQPHGVRLKSGSLKPGQATVPGHAIKRNSVFTIVRDCLLRPWYAHALLLGGAIGAPLVARAAPLPLTEQWQPLSPGIDVKEVVVHPEALFPSRILFARVAPARTQMRVLTAADYGYKQLSAREIAIHAGASLTINANFFDDKGAPLGVVVSQGTLKNRAHRSGRTLSGVFLLGERGFRVIHRDAFTPEGVIEAVQAGPRLAVQGAPAPGVRDTFSTRRAGVCVTAGGDIIVFCVSSGLFTLDMKSLQALLVSPSLGCVDALNLDGGGSAQLFARNLPATTGAETSVAAANPREVSVEGIDRVPVFLGFFDRSVSTPQPLESPPAPPTRTPA